jgi:hypothetical protein
VPRETSKHIENLLGAIIDSKEFERGRIYHNIFSERHNVFDETDVKATIDVKDMNDTIIATIP